jgi:hypothetical protein
MHFGDVEVRYLGGGKKLAFVAHFLPTRHHIEIEPVDLNR